MRSIGRFFQPVAVAGGDQATAETDPELRELPRMSVDGRWWWDGERWLATSTPDGLWQWDGDRWRPTIELAGVRPRDLATTLALLAEDRYARAAAILVDRAREWRPPGDLRELVQRAAALRRRLLRVEQAFTGAAAGPSGLFRRLRANLEERQQVEEEQALLDTQYRALMVHLGRRAPRPSVKEADDLLTVARLLDRRASSITDALAAADEAERARIRAIEVARREVQAAQAARRQAHDAAREALAIAEEASLEELRVTRDHVREAMEPPATEPMAQVGPLCARRELIETPAGRLAADSVRASVAPAVALWRQHRDLVEEVLLLEPAEGDAFLRCLTERRRDLFLLLVARARTVLWHCPPGEEKPLRQFATAVNRRASRAAEPAADRLEAADELIRQLDRKDSDAMDAVAEAREALSAVERDPLLAEAIESAGRLLEQARGEPADLQAARRRLMAEVGAVTSPPASLGRAP